MQKEFETKVLDVNPEEIVTRLRMLGAQETPEVLIKRYMFDNNPQQIEFFRIRESHGKVTLAYKHKVRGNTQVGETLETEVEVSDFDKLVAIFKQIPFQRVFYQESKRHVFRLKEIEFSLDTWPLLNPFLEIESYDKAKISEGLALLDLEGKDAGDKDIKVIYAENGIDIHAYQELKFDN